MQQLLKLQEKFKALNCCVVLPTFNNGTSLKQVLERILDFTNNIIVINDGSTDATGEILEQYSHLEIISYSQNKGKGEALKIGFKKALEIGYDYAISIDSDGQHFPEDFIIFLKALENKSPEEPELLIIGDRKMNSSGIPTKSRIGNTLSSFWFWVETGISLRDTQCGFRLYPLKSINSFNLFTSGFELEIEVLVKAAWNGVQVKNLPIQVYYDPYERISHFKPFRDVARITVLNIGFVFMALFYILPRNMLRKFLNLDENRLLGKNKKTKFPLN